MMRTAGKPIEQYQREREAENRKYAEEISRQYAAQTGREIKPSDDEVLKYRLWEEQQHVCPYTGAADPHFGLRRLGPGFRHRAHAAAGPRRRRFADEQDTLRKPFQPGDKTGETVGRIVQSCRDHGADRIVRLAGKDRDPAETDRSPNPQEQRCNLQGRKGQRHPTPSLSEAARSTGAGSTNASP